MVLVATALGKPLDMSGFAEVVGRYQALPDWAWYPAGIALTVVEWGIAIWLLSSRRLPQAALAAALLHTVFMVWAASALYREIDVPNCGCFGVFYARPLTISTIYQDIFMLGTCLLLYGLARSYQATTQVNKAPGPANGGAAKL